MVPAAGSFTSAEPLKFQPTNGVTVQSADAFLGAAARATAQTAVVTRALRNDIDHPSSITSDPGSLRLQAICPWRITEESVLTGSNSTAELRCGEIQQFPRAARRGVRRAQVADRKPKNEAAVELGVREEDLARCVDASRMRACSFVRRVVAQPEADDAEGHRRDALEAVALRRPTTRIRCASRMCSASRARRPSAPKWRSTHPQLQRAESSSELNAGVHQVSDARVAFARLQILGRQRERLRGATSMRRQ